jgi:hypothetical protein
MQWIELAKHMVEKRDFVTTKVNLRFYKDKELLDKSSNYQLFMEAIR